MLELEDLEDFLIFKIKELEATRPIFIQQDAQAIYEVQIDTYKEILEFLRDRFATTQFGAW